MNIVFRTDASHQIGTGHIMRCLTLAKALRDRGAECRFICREHAGNLIGLLQKQEFEVIPLPVPDVGFRHLPEIDAPPLAHASWLGTNWATDAEQSIVGTGDTAVDWLIVDHYALDARWESAMRQKCRKLLVIDDIADRRHDCDLLLDQNLFSDMAERYTDRLPVHCGQMLGPHYALLQPQYAELHPRLPPRAGTVRRILVYFGGADANNLTGMAISAFYTLGREDVALDVVINESNPHAESLRRQLEASARVTLHVGLPSLAPLMAKADLAIGAGGATSWERCCLGLPALVITLAENQIPIASELQRLGMIRWLGDATQVSEAMLVRELVEICDTGLSPEWSDRCRQKVDGRGTERVASILFLDGKTKLKARLARIDDEALILQWANERQAQQNADVSGKFDCNTQRTLFLERLRDVEHCLPYVVETECGLPIGQVRFDYAEGGWGLDFDLDSRARYRGLENAFVRISVLAFRGSMTGPLVFRHSKESQSGARNAPGLHGKSCDIPGDRRLSIALCSDANSWINPYLPELIIGWLDAGHSVVWTHSASELPVGDLCFYLSYGRIVDAATRVRYKSNLVVHESDLPRGRGWSPMSWLILEGEHRIPVTLLEAEDDVDAGSIYLQEWLELRGDELSAQWRQLQASATLRLCQNFVAEYPGILKHSRPQEGAPTYYRRRTPADSKLDPSKTIAEQFNLLRIVDNDKFPAYFDVNDRRLYLRVDGK